MKKKELEKLCSAVKAGEEKFVENLETHYTGRIIHCSTDRIHVDISGRRESWPMESCQETMGSTFKHREKTLDTHPWDVDRFNPYN